VLDLYELNTVTRQASSKLWQYVSMSLTQESRQVRVRLLTTWNLKVWRSVRLVRQASKTRSTPKPRHAAGQELPSPQPRQQADWRDGFAGRYPARHLRTELSPAEWGHAGPDSVIAVPISRDPIRLRESEVCIMGFLFNAIWRQNPLTSKSETS
jgi:hypothetical protein